MRSLTGFAVLSALAITLFHCGEASAQNAPAISPRVQTPRAQSARSAPRAAYSLGIGRRPISKPFANIQRRPTVSPYINLGRNEAAGLPNYQTLVRPQIEAQEALQRQQRSLNRLNSEFRNFQDQRLSQQFENQGIRATGHQSRFMNLSHFYPSRR